MPPPDLVSLIARAQRGETTAKDFLIRHYQQPMAAFVYAVTGSPALIEDLTQDIFLKMLLKLHQVREPERFEAWLFRLARNTCRDHFRREKWRSLFLPADREHEQLPAPAAAASGDMEEFLAALQTLPASQRELLVLLQENEWTYDELASITGSTVSSVKSRLFRARSELKRLLHHE